VLTAMAFSSTRGTSLRTVLCQGPSSIGRRSTRCGPLPAALGPAEANRRVFHSAAQLPRATPGRFSPNPLTRFGEASVLFRSRRLRPRDRPRPKSPQPLSTSIVFASKGLVSTKKCCRSRTNERSIGMGARADGRLLDLYWQKATIRLWHS